jgi:DNA-binding NarL/FixJ family response regulator
MFNPIRPEPQQRNRAQDCVELHRLVTPESAAAARRLLTEVYPAMGARDYRTLRVLVCEGSSLLAYVGVVQPEAPSLEQADVLRRLIPALRRRLSIERLLADDEARAASIDATLELVPRATFLSNADGRVVHANSLGRLGLGGSNRASLVDDVRAATRGGGPPGWRAIRLAATSRVAASLVVAPTLGTSVERAVASMARTLGLTPAQTRVLSWIAQGCATRRIAAELGVAERTVEAHVTAILDKAQVETRGGLLAKFLDRRAPVYSR